MRLNQVRLSILSPECLTRHLVENSNWGRWMNMQSTEDFRGSENTLYYAMMMDPCHYTLSKPEKAHHQQTDPHANYGLGTITMRQRRFINCNNCPTLGGGTSIMRDAVHMWV